MTAPTSIDNVNGSKLVLTVEEAARALRIGRSAAYEAARRWLETGGAEGLPVVRLGRRLRVPTHALDRLLSGAANTRPDA
jgi:excisionase family DNA binding protein